MFDRPNRERHYNVFCSMYGSGLEPRFRVPNYATV